MWLFKLLSLSKVNWLLGKKKKKLWLEMLLDWTAWLSISIWIGERQLAMSEEEEVLWETSTRHLCFRCFSQNFIADLLGYSKHGISNLQCCFSNRIWYHNLRCHFDQVRFAWAPQRERAWWEFHTLLNKEIDKNKNELCVTHACWHHF